MPSKKEHLRLAKKFHRFIDNLTPAELAENIELATAAAYWSGLHQIDAVFALPTINKHPESDGERIHLMLNGGTTMRGLFKHYRLLKDRYNEGMYLAQPLTEIDFDAEIREALSEIIAKTGRALGIK